MKVLEQSNWSKKWYLKKGSVITNSNGFGSNLETIVTQEYRQEHIRYRRSDPNQPSTSSTIQQQEKPQDFELAELLFSSSTSNARDFINPSIQPKFQSVLNEADKLGFKSEEILSKLSRETKRFKSFETRFQSFVDQIPSYLHSSIKDGFFPHFFLGMFSTLLDTKLNKKLNIKRLYYGFDTAQTLKIVAVTGQDTDPNQIDKVSVFIFSEGVSASGNDGKAKFTQGEWESIKQKIQLPARLASIKPDVKVVKIAKNKIKDQDNNERTEIKIKVEDKAISQVNTSPSEFTQIVKQLHAKDSAGKDIYLEDYIAKLASPNQVEVQRVIDEKILLHIKKVHANLKLPDNVYASKAREASLHAFVTGVFVNDRYRDNTRIYLEQFAGRGYADIVLLVRGPNRAADSVPIVIELKAGTKQGTAPVDALEQAKKYTEGFQPNKMRILTTSNDVLCVGLNLDYPSDVKNALDMIDDNSISDVRLKDRLGRQIKNEDLLSIINNWNNNNRKSLRKQIEQRGFRLTFNSEIVPVAKPTAPLMKRILTDINNWDGSKNTEPALKKQLTDTISREYHTFPANKETKDTYYFSRYMLGQSILVNKLDQGDIKKYVFSYGEEPLREYKGEYSLLECPVTTLVFVQEKTAFILHMREANTKEFYYDKKIPMTGIPGIEEIKNVVEVHMSLKKQGKTFTKIEKFEELFEIKQIEKYDPSSNQQHFQGNYIEIPNSDQLKQAFDKAINAQHVPEFAVDKAILSETHKILLTQMAGLPNARTLLSKIDDSLTDHKVFLTKMIELAETNNVLFSEMQGIIESFRYSITNEARLQAVFNGMFTGLSDLRIQASSTSGNPSEKIVVIPEFQTGAGGRIDMLIQGIGYPNHGTKEYIPIGLELKYDDSIKLSKNEEKKSITEQNKILRNKEQQLVTKLVSDQIDRYAQGAAWKTITDSNIAFIQGIVFNAQAKDGNSLLLTTNTFTPAIIAHSSTTLAKLCLSGGKTKRSTNVCLLSWTDVDKFNAAEQHDKRNPDKIKIDGEKFLNCIKDTEDHDKRTQLVQFADEIIHSVSGNEQVVGKFQDLVNTLTGNHKVINYLNKVNKISGMTMHGMMTKSMLVDFFHEDYEGVAINAGFITGDQGLAKVSEIISMKGSKLVSGNKLILGRALGAAAPFLARGTSAFVAYDLVNQVKALKSGNEDALVGVIGDSICLTIDVAAVGIEIAGVFGVLGGVSSITGPIGAAIGGIVFVGTDIYFAVKTVDRIDRIIHLSGWEKFKEGWRAFLGMKPEEYLRKLMEEKEVNNELVRQKIQVLKRYPNIKRYVFPTGKLVTDSCHSVTETIHAPNPYGVCIPGIIDRSYCETTTIVKHKECTKKIEEDLDNIVLLDKKITNIQWRRSKPDNQNGGTIFCYPEGNYISVPSGGAYKCNNAIGVTDDSVVKPGNYTLIGLGKGTDTVRGFPDSPHIFLVEDGKKSFVGSNADDIFILQGDHIIGSIDAHNGSDTLDLSNFALHKNSISINMEGNLVNGNRTLLLKNINKVIGRRNKQDVIYCQCNTQCVSSQGGNNSENDKIIVPSELKGCFYKIQLLLTSNTTVSNDALQGNFSYIIESGNGRTKIDIKNINSRHIFIFNYTLSDIQNIDVINDGVNYQLFFNSTNPSTRSIFSTEINIPLKNNNTMYLLNDGTEVKLSGDNLYAMQNSNKSVDKLIQEYPPIARRLGMFIVVRSSVNNESVSIGHDKQGTSYSKAFVIYNDALHKNHLIGGKVENLYVITSGYEIFNNTNEEIPETIIYDLHESNLTDTLDLRQLKQQVNRELRYRLTQDGEDILIQPFIPSNAQQKEYNVTSVRLKNALKNNWYKRLRVVLNDAPMQIEYNNNTLTVTPLPLVFTKDKKIVVITVQDIEEKTQLEVFKQAGKYSFYRLDNNLIVTNIDVMNEEHWCTILLSNFYKEHKMQTLSIKFTDKDVFLKNEMDSINNAVELQDKVDQHINSYDSIIDQIQTPAMIAFRDKYKDKFLYNLELHCREQNTKEDDKIVKNIKDVQNPIQYLHNASITYDVVLSQVACNTTIIDFRPLSQQIRKNLQKKLQFRISYYGVWDVLIELFYRKDYGRMWQQYLSQPEEQLITKIKLNKALQEGLYRDLRILLNNNTLMRINNNISGLSLVAVSEDSHNYRQAIVGTEDGVEWQVGLTNKESVKSQVDNSDVYQRNRREINVENTQEQLSSSYDSDFDQPVSSSASKLEFWPIELMKNTCFKIIECAKSLVLNSSTDEKEDDLATYQIANSTSIFSEVYQDYSPEWKTCSPTGIHDRVMSTQDMSSYALLIQDMSSHGYAKEVGGMCTSNNSFINTFNQCPTSLYGTVMNRIN